MRAYIARLNAEQDHPREIVGFFFAEDRRQLYDMIDECCDVDSCEIRELGPGGIYWGSAVDYVVPHPRETAETAPGLPRDATVTDWWTPALFDENEDRWERITPADLDATSGL